MDANKQNSAPTLPRTSMAEMADIVAGSGGGSSSSSVPLSEPNPSGRFRRERGAIAAQACDNCRTRKQRCDERRPRCSTCVRFNLECQYREPQPTKKDKTLGEILERLKTLESKIDGLGASTALDTTATATATASLDGPATRSTIPDVPVSGLVDPGILAELGSLAHSPLRFHNEPWSPAPPLHPAGPDSHDTYRYSPALYQILCWPAVQQLLRPLAHRLPGIASLSTENDALRLVLGLHQPRSRLPEDTSVLPSTDGSAAAADAATQPGDGIPSAPPLTWDSVFRLSQAYFDVFNCVYPILDRHTFQTRTLTTAFGGLYDDNNSDTLDDSTTLTFLVAALGEVALAGLHGPPPGRPRPPYTSQPGPPGSIRGGTPEQPAGLALFNEARKRMGFALSKCSLETVQIYALAGIYCGTCFRHMESWRFTTTASLACQALITSKPSELASAHIDLLRRIFWYCLIVETHFHIELGLPLTGLDKYEALVGLPDFGGPYSQEDYLTNQASHSQEYFASQLVLRRLFIVFHNTLSAAPRTASSAAVPASAPMAAPPPPLPPQPPLPFSFPATVGQVTLQLDGWRGMLPPALRWSEAGLPGFPQGAAAGGSSGSGPVGSSSSSSSGGGGGLGGKGPDLGNSAMLSEPPAHDPFALNVQAALLRTRYYSIKCMLYRPFFYKALHRPDLLTPDDAAGAAECLRACLHWPAALAPTRAHKQLVPCQFVATQTMLGILLLLRLAQHLPALPRIQEILYGGAGGNPSGPPGSASRRRGGGDRGGDSGGSGSSSQQRFEHDAHEAAALCIDWIHDQRDVDRAAEWAWEIAKDTYHLDE